MTRCFVFACSLIVLGTLMPRAVDAEPRLALLIGNDNYMGSPLATCINDARSVSKWLHTIGYTPDQIGLMTDANREEMVNGLGILLKKCKNSRPKQVVIYYSGHGFYLEDDDGDEGPEDGLDEAFVGVFTKPLESPEQLEDAMLRDDDFYRYVAAIREHCDQLVVIIDSCFSGGGVKGGIGGETNPTKAFPYSAFFSRGGQKGINDNVDKATARNIELQRPEQELNALPDSGAQLLVLTASNQFQPAQAGRPPNEPLSKYTDALLKLIGNHEPSNGKLTLRSVESRLGATLKHIPQQPLVLTAGISKDSGLVPDIFDYPQAKMGNRRVADLVYALLTLPDNKRQDWGLQVSCTVPQPVKIGDRFALKVQAQQSGYLIVVTVEANGRVAIQFPNRYRPVNEITANKTFVIPYKDAFRATPPAGNEEFFVYLLERNPIKGFDFGKHDGPLIVGSVDELLSWYPDLKNAIGPQFTGENLTRAIRVRPRRNADPDVHLPAWDRKRFVVKTR